MKKYGHHRSEWGSFSCCPYLLHYLESQPKPHALLKMPLTFIRSDSSYIIRLGQTLKADELCPRMKVFVYQTRGPRIRQTSHMVQVIMLYLLPVPVSWRASGYPFSAQGPWPNMVELKLPQSCGKPQVGAPTCCPGVTSMVTSHKIKLASYNLKGLERQKAKMLFKIRNLNQIQLNIYIYKALLQDLKCSKMHQITYTC